MFRISLSTISLLLLLTPFQIFAQQEQQSAPPFQNHGFIDVNGYYDTRSYTDLTINALVNMNHRFQYFSLCVFTGSENNNNTDVERFISEQNIRWKIKKGSPIDISVQYVIKSNPRNDALRVGIKWHITKMEGVLAFFEKLNFDYFLNTFPVEIGYDNTGDYKGQFEHVYRIGLLKNHAYLSGFADQNMLLNNKNIETNWVTEHQLGIRLIKDFYAIVEYRRNDYVDSSGFGFGLEYKIIF